MYPAGAATLVVGDHFLEASLGEYLEADGVAAGEEPEDDLLDPINMCLMNEPVRLVQTGMTYDLESIQEWFERGHRTCPMTNTKLDELVAVPDLERRAKIQRWKAERRRGSQEECRPGDKTEPRESYHTARGQDERPEAGCSVDNKVYKFAVKSDVGNVDAHVQLERHEWEIHYAHFRLSNLLGESSKASQLALRLDAAAGTWACPLDPGFGPTRPISTKCYVAGRYATFGDSGAKALAQLLVPRPSRDGSWKWNSAVRELHLPWNNIGPDGGSALAMCLEPQRQRGGSWAGHPSLAVVSLKRNNIGSQGAVAFAEALAPRQRPDGSWAFFHVVQELDLASNNIGTDGAMALAAALKPRQNPDGTWTFPPLATLNLLENPDVGNDGTLCLLEALLSPRPDAHGGWLYNPFLKALYLDGHKVSEEAVVSLVKDSIAPRVSPGGGLSFNAVLSCLQIVLSSSAESSKTSMSPKSMVRLFLHDLRRQHSVQRALQPSRRLLQSCRRPARGILPTLKRSGRLHLLFG